MQLPKRNASSKSKALAGNIINKMEGLSKPRKKFMLSVMILFLSMRGRYNFKGMERYGNYSEKSYRLHFEEDFAFGKFNLALWKEHLSSNCIIAFDPSYLPKSGKHTPGKGVFYSGCLGKAVGGLEIGGIGIVDLNNNTAFNYEAVLTPPPKELKAKGKTLVDHYAELIIDRHSELEQVSKFLAVDAYFSKKKFVNQIKASTNFELICKLRQNADLKYFYKGPKREGRGRPKKYAGKVDTKNVDKRRFKKVYQDDDVILFQTRLWSVSLKREINVVYIEFLDEGKPTKRYAFLFSTDLELDGRLIYKYYKARFQIEFLFRDAKQHVGLTHCQARSPKKMHFHYNMALTAVGLAKAAHFLNQNQTEKEPRKPISIADVKTSYFNELMLELFLSNFHVDRNLIKNKQAAEKILNLGVIAA